MPVQAILMLIVFGFVASMIAFLFIMRARLHRQLAESEREQAERTANDATRSYLGLRRRTRVTVQVD